ncbi:MAG TPA: ABC transporter permease, partial [Accumulibacter sp.]|nr:ABC transporter permease [Accumulibacter sp.]
MNSLLQDFLLAFRNVVRQRRRSGMAILAVAFGIITLLLAGGFIEWTLMGMREWTIGSRLGHIQVARPGYFQLGQSDPFAYLLAQDSADRAGLEKIDGVKIVGARLAFGGLISHGEATISFLGEGVEPDKEVLLSSTLFITKGQGLSTSDAKGIIIGAGLAANLGVDVGDQVVLMANTPAGGVSAAECHVLGLFSTVSKAYDDAAVRLPISTAQSLLKVGGSHLWVMLLDKTEDTSAVLAKLRDSFAGRSLEFVPWNDLADFYNKTVTLFRKQVGVIKVIIAIIIVLSISNTLMMNVVERTGEIGTALAVGITRSKIMRSFVLEGVLLGVGGGLIGMLIGAVAAHIISLIGIPMPP